jgi:subtilase-type serine protease
MNKAGMVLGAVLAAPLLGALPAQAQITYQTLQAPGTTTTGVTGICGDNITGSYSSMGGLLYRIDAGQFQPYPVATANGANFPGVQSSQPYSPTFGSPNGILRAVGTFTPIGGSADSSYIWDNAAAPGQQASILNVPGASNTIAHSQFGNQVVGNFNTTSNMGTIFNYNMAVPFGYPRSVASVVLKRQARPLHEGSPVRSIGLRTAYLGSGLAS